MLRLGLLKTHDVGFHVGKKGVEVTLSVTGTNSVDIPRSEGDGHLTRLGVCLRCVAHAACQPLSQPAGKLGENRQALAQGGTMGFALLKLAGLYFIVLFMGILAFHWATWIGIAYSVFWVWFTYSQVHSAWKKN